MLDSHLEERARLRIEGGLPELFRVHLAEAFVALDSDILLAEFEDRIDESDRPGDREFLVLGGELAAFHVKRLELGREGVDPARFSRADHGSVDDVTLGNAAARAREFETAVGKRGRLPAALMLGRQTVEAGRDIVRRVLRLLAVLEDIGVERTG